MVRSLSDAAAALAAGDLTVRGLLSNASNYTLLVTVGDPAGDVHAVYKPCRGERPLWDFPPGTLYRREVAAFVVSEFLGWGLVPPTVERDGPLGVGSVQLFVPHDPRRHYFSLLDEPRHEAQLTQIAYFDLLVNNADRKGSHVLLEEPAGRLRAIDHGVTFHAEPKLRTVIWDLGRVPVEEAWRADVARLAAALGDVHEQVVADLAGLLEGDEIEALRQRAVTLQDLRRLPDPPTDRRAYPWPPL